MLKVTDAALEQIRVAALQGRAVGMALRIAARRADDGSVEYGMGFDEARADDLVQEHDDLTLVVAPGHGALVAGTLLDWVEYEPGERRFIFIPPAVAEAAAEPAAGCGSGSGSGSGGCARCGAAR